MCKLLELEILELLPLMVKLNIIGKFFHKVKWYEAS